MPSGSDASTTSRLALIDQPAPRFGLLPRLSFKSRIFILLLLVSCTLSLLLGWYVYQRMEQSLYDQIGQRALVQAQEIALMPEVASAIASHDSARLSALIKPFKAVSDASYIVIGDRQGLHLMHTDPHVPVGSPMRGGDNAPVLESGRSIVTLESGTLGVSWRGKAPVRDAAGNVIGVVSVGYFQSTIERWGKGQFMPLLAVLLASLYALFICAWLFARSIKRQMFGLEPHEIARMLRQQEAVFDSIYEGVLSIDTQRRIIAINRAARDMLALSSDMGEPTGMNLADLIPGCPLFTAAESDPDIKDQICLFNQLNVIASRVAIRIGGRVHGWVISFRRQDDINTLSLQLSQVRRYADNLRVIRHEHLNWMSTISGLLHAKAYDEATRLIQSQSEIQQQVLDYISSTFGNYHLCGLLIGKFYRARELGIELEFDSGCELNALPASLSDVEWMSIIGNLLDNAFEAVLSARSEGGKVVLFLSDGGEELIIEVADNGTGVDAAVRDRLFERGVSTRGDSERGIGLYLVKSYVQRAAGTITVEDNLPQGAIISIFVPKRSHADA
ncbi:MAG: sensor histidine kinase [Paludibacterium sp.]|uniref:ATP-binding protein n=1 Tax=Paludibacterium sp. TaxID=1917523 RepID=UPI0025D6E0A1|nr:sensor histidine kinase [Paludibacterium sp.]MBV8045653.1 sensor histidine kinase [Paludibacterium sp.]MBV8649456.1 sensor histidine kinase [Paludibacterium sp.]